MLTETVLAATDGGVLLDLQADSPRPGVAHASVLVGGRIVHVDLDARLGTATVAPTAPRARPSRRSVLAHR